LPLRGTWLQRSVLAMLWMSGSAFAQAPPKPAAIESPKFEIRRFIFEDATLVPRERLEAATRPYTGRGRTFADVQRALETIERTYSKAGYSAAQVVLPEQVLERGDIRFQIIEAKIGRLVIQGNEHFDDANVRACVPSLAPGEAPNVHEIGRNLRVAN
jgi:hemolysin activation/secretion protein